jgi:hypothetical protein
MALMSRPDPIPVDVISALPAELPDVALEELLVLAVGVVADVVEVVGDIVELMTCKSWNC